MPLVCAPAVSYTHLDVYKRQVYVRGRPEPGAKTAVTLYKTVSYTHLIQSNYTTFGAGVAIPGTGISLQNRGANFSLEENSDNCLAGGKRSCLLYTSRCV